MGAFVCQSLNAVLVTSGRAGQTSVTKRFLLLRIRYLKLPKITKQIRNTDVMRGIPDLFSGLYYMSELMCPWFRPPFGLGLNGNLIRRLVHLCLTKALDVAGFFHFATLHLGGLLELLAVSEFAHGAGAVKFALEYLEGFLDAVALLYGYNDHKFCSFCLLVLYCMMFVL